MKNSKCVGVCKLCLKTDSLVESHIIPKFFWKHLKKHKFYYILYGNKFDNKKYQKDLIENLFCENCDTVILSQIEKYLADFLFNKEFPFNSKTISESFTVAYNLNYKSIKLGLLSILWRMSLSNNKIFELVNLGEGHNENIRKYIINNENISENMYPIYFTAILKKGSHLQDIILQPTSYRKNGNRYYRCIMGGFLFTFVVGSSRIDPLDALMTIKEDGSWLLNRMEVSEIEFLENVLKNVSKTLNKHKTVLSSD